MSAAAGSGPGSAISLASDDFELLGLPRRFELDTAELTQAWKARQAQVHPDRFAAEGAAAQRVAAQWSARLNEAHQRLKSPLKRAVYLCTLAGHAPDQRGAAVDSSLLMQHMAWREALDEALRGPEPQAALAALQAEVQALRDALWRDVGQALDERSSAEAAAPKVNALLYTEKLWDDLARHLRQSTP